MSKRRVVVTGLGALTPIGNSAADFWKNALDGVNGVGPITQFDAEKHAVKFACEVKGFDPLSVGDRKEVRKMDRFTQLGLSAALDREVVDRGDRLLGGVGCSSFHVAAIIGLSGRELRGQLRH